MSARELASIDLDSLLDAVREDLVKSPGAIDVARVARLLRAGDQVLGAADVLTAAELVRDHLDGLGPLQDLISPGVTDLLVNGDGSVWIDGRDGLQRTDRVLTTQQARDLAVRLAVSGGRRLDDAMPWADAHLPSGIRFHALLPPLSPTGPVLSLRLPAAEPLGMDDLESLGAFPAVIGDLLRRIVAARVPFLVTGGTGTGKSTLLGAMLAAVDAKERIVIVEDALELQVDHPHVVSLQSRHANSEGAGLVDLSELVRQCLRMRPDRIVLGECRGAEIRDLLQALNTGHEGGCGTIHANTAADVPARLEALGALAGLDRAALAAQAASALDLVIHLGRTAAGRCLQEIAVLHRATSGALTCTSALTVHEGEIRQGPAAAQLQHLLTTDSGSGPTMRLARTGRRAA